jgi:hypothetical protein
MRLTGIFEHKNNLKYGDTVYTLKLRLFEEIDWDIRTCIMGSRKFKIRVLIKLCALNGVAVFLDLFLHSDLFYCCYLTSLCI